MTELCQRDGRGSAPGFRIVIAAAPCLIRPALLNRNEITALYAQCPRQDKVKISRGIVLAVRELGGRFLELDERTSVYSDIGDKKAVEKTSQALREGQTKLRQQIYEQEKRTGRAASQRQFSSEGYFGYSVQILESLYAAESGEAGRGTVGGAGAVQQQPAAEPTNPQIAAAMCQFEGMKKTGETLHPDRVSISGMRNSLNGDVSLMGLSGLFSTASINNLVNSSKTDRKTIESVLTAEIVDLIRMSEPQLEDIERITATMPGSFAFDAAAGDRVSALRMTDVAMRQTQDGPAAPAAAAGGEAGPPPVPGAPPAGTAPRDTDASLMERSIMTYGVDDMTAATDVDGAGGGKKRSASELSKSITDTNNGAEILAGLKGEGNAMEV